MPSDYFNASRAVAAATRRRILAKIIVTFTLLLAASAIIWLAAYFNFHRYPWLLGQAALAYTLGLGHALDADHISAIDNLTRKLMNEGRRPVLVGFFFSLGHSTIVILLTIGIAITATGLQSHFSSLKSVGNIIGTSISGLFLLLIAGINILVLRGVISAFRRVKQGEPYDEQNLDVVLTQLGFIGRMLRPVVRLVDRSWKMYGVGFLFGLGFDTATQVGLLGIAAVAATQGLPIWSILLLPALFTAGMCLVDTLDGVLMLGAYGWAYIHPIRKLYYNMTITALSVLIALFIGGLEVLGMIVGECNLHGYFWDSIGSLTDKHFSAIGVAIITLFITCWAASIIGYHALGYKRLELAAAPAGADATDGLVSRD